MENMRSDELKPPQPLIKIKYVFFVKGHQEFPFMQFSWVKKVLFSDCTSFSIGGPTCVSKITDVPVPPPFCFSFFLSLCTNFTPVICDIMQTPFLFFWGHTSFYLLNLECLLNLNKIPQPSRCEKSESADENHQFYLNQKTPDISNLAIF